MKSFGWVVGEDKVLRIEEIRRLRTYCRSLRRKGLRLGRYCLVRDWFVVELGLFSGLRVAEMTQLQVKDLFIEQGRSSILVRRGKGGRRRFVWINSRLRSESRAFLHLRKKFGLNSFPDDYVFTSKDSAPLTTRALQKRFKLCVKSAGLSERYSIHCLRHTYATFLLKAGRDLKLVKEQLGHSSVKITEVYISLIRDDVMKALEGIYDV